MLLSLALPLVSCNEKVSSELQNSSSSSGSTTGGSSGSGSGTQSNFTFEVSLSSPAQAGHKIHRTGFSFDGSSYTSRKTTPCKVTSPDNVSLSNALYDAEALLAHDDKSYDISCFVEAEELSLYLNGVDFNVVASPNACEIVSYSPFSYFSYLPGNSTTTYNTVKCPDSYSGGGIPSGANYTPPTGAAMDCYQWRDSTQPSNLLTAPTDEQLCRYNYASENGPQCDIGTVTVNERNYIEDPGTPNTLILDPATPLTTRTVKCGGKIANCVNGAIKKGEGMSLTDYSSVIYHSTTVKDESFAKTWKLPPLINENPQRGTNRPYVNYRRELANQNIDYGDITVSQVAYENSFNPGFTGMQLYQTTFEPSLMSNYARNRKMNLTNNYVLAADLTAFDTANRYKSTPYAAEPFMSISSTYRINPFYTFYCLNKSYENKARIRVVIREWDRLFGDPATNSNFDYLSDIFLGSLGSLDNDFNDSYGEPFNDFNDWDDFVTLQRDAGIFSNSATDYIPSLGFFNQSIFPKDLSTAEPE
jgi:hypothetical protein